MIIINNPTQRRTFTQFRISCHKLQIEIGRYHKIPQEERICEYCDLNEVEDEYHFSLSCKYYEKYRNDLISNLQNFPIPTSFHHKDDLQSIISSKDSTLINTFSKFLQLCFIKRNNCLN